MYQSTSNLFHPDISDEIIQIIAEHHGDEVFFVAWVDREGIVSEIEAVAFGNEISAPAPLSEGLKGDLVIHNHPSGDLRASNADINIASLLATRKLGFYIINNSCSQVNIVYKPKPRIFLSEQKVCSIFEKNGLLQKHIGAYEERTEQEKLVAKIVDAINNNKILLAEAGTGTGKSLSYLIPAALWAVQSDKRVFITTHTINLQNQIAQKDADLVSTIVEKITGLKPRFAVLVGRANYICPKNLHELQIDSEKSFSLFDNIESIKNQLDLISTWMNSSEHGLKSEIPEKISPELWEEISAATPNCTRKDCPLYTECFYFKARMIAESSQILIGNHALLLSAIDNENGFTTALPYFSGLILDEAHNIPQITLNSMAETFSFGSIFWRLSRLYRKKNDKTLGQLSLLHDRYPIEQDDDLSEIFYTVSSEILSLSQTLKEQENYVKSLLQDNSEPYIEITNELLATELWIAIKKILSSIFDQIKLIEVNLLTLTEKIQELTKQEKVLEILRIIDIYNTGIYNIRKTFENIFSDTISEKTAVKQMEINSGGVFFSVGPASIEDFLAKYIFRPKDFTILTSATLSTEDNFDFFSQNIGLSFAEQNRLDSIILESPFDYKNQMKVLVLNEKSLSYNRKEEEKILLVEKCVQTVSGGTLLLFTSYKSMHIFYDALADKFTKSGLYPMKQGDFSREYLINIMKSKDYVIVFGTSSFWEGIDVQGNNLRFIVMDKLPFDNPFNPLNKAICRLIEDQGKNPFMEYSVPKAVLKYKQGIGRLIRSKKDRGIVLVLDGRIFDKLYGKKFVHATKPAEIVYLNAKEILLRIEEFFV